MNKFLNIILIYQNNNVVINQLNILKIICLNV